MTETEIRLECLRLATVRYTRSGFAPAAADVLVVAQQFYAWVVLLARPGSTPPEPQGLPW